MRHPRVRHAGDTPLEGFAWRKSPRRLDSSHVVSPQARCERRADLRNELVWMLQIVPADADDVPALGLEMALTLALVGERGVDAAGVVTVFGAAVELDADFFGREPAIDEVTTAPRVHLDLCAHAGEARRAQLVQHTRFSWGGTSGICVSDDPLCLRAAPSTIAKTRELRAQ